MKLLIVNSLYAPHIIGGAEISTQILAESLASYMQADVHVMTVGGHSVQEGIRVEVINGITVHRIPHSNLYWVGDGGDRHAIHKVFRRLIDFHNPTQRRMIERCVQAIQPDLVHTQNLSGMGTAIWRIASSMSIPVIHTLRDYSLLSPVSSPLGSKILTFLYTLSTKSDSRKVLAVSGISRHILDRHLSHKLFPASTSLVIPNAVDGMTECPLDRSFESSLTLGYFGRIEPEKGVQLFLSAVSELPPNKIAKVYVCGEGSLRGELEERFKSDKRFIFTGKVEREACKRLMGETDATFVPSTWEEPFGRVIIESYQAGVPVYGAEIGGIPDVVMDPDFLFQPGSVQAIKEKILFHSTLSSEQKKELQGRCIEHSKLYTTESLARLHWKLYQKALDTRSMKKQMASSYNA